MKGAALKFRIPGRISGSSPITYVLNPENMHATAEGTGGGSQALQAVLGNVNAVEVYPFDGWPCGTILLGTSAEIFGTLQRIATSLLVPA